MGAFLKRAGHDITFVDIEREHVAAIGDPARGLRIDWGLVEERTVGGRPLHQMGSTAAGLSLPLRKVHHTDEATRALAPHLARDGYAPLSLQNGLCEDIIAGIVRPERTVGAFINFGADWHGPGQILDGNRGAFVIGELTVRSLTGYGACTGRSPRGFGARTRS